MKKLAGPARPKNKKTLRENLNSPALIIISGALYILSQALMFYILHPIGSGNVLKLQVCFSDELVRETIEAWKNEGILVNYQRHFIPDFLHPLWYGVFLASLMAWLFAKRGAAGYLDLFFIFPLSAALLDILENVCHLFFITDIKNVSPFLSDVSAAASTLKWAFSLASIVVIIVFALRKNKTAKHNAGGFANKKTR